MATQKEETLKKAINCHQTGQFKEAEQFYKAVLESEPHHPVANHNLGILAAQFGQYDAAISLINNALKADPENLTYQTSLSKAMTMKSHGPNSITELYNKRAERETQVPPKKNTDDRSALREENEQLKVRIITDKPGWILYRMAEEIAKRLPNAKINEPYPDANIHYYINYKKFTTRPNDGIVVANFTHYDPNLATEQWSHACKEVDHCVAIANTTAKDVKHFGVAEENVTVIPIGADKSFRPKMTLGLGGRVYKSGRKGEHLVQALQKDCELMQDLQIVALSESWGVTTWKTDQIDDFYRSIDYLLIPSLYEGGPVPFMEALACGTLSIAPAIGVIPDFPHIEYDWNNIDSLKKVILQLKHDFLKSKNKHACTIAPYNWENWAQKHIELFHRLLEKGR